MIKNILILLFVLFTFGCQHMHVERLEVFMAGDGNVTIVFDGHRISHTNTNAALQIPLIPGI